MKYDLDNCEHATIMSVKLILADIIKEGWTMKQVQPFQANQGSLITKDTESKVKAILEAGTAENTKRAYRGDIEYFMAWASVATGYDMGFPVPVALVVRFITDHLYSMDNSTDKNLVVMGIKARLGTHSISTVSRRISSLSVAHEAQKMENPCRSQEVKTLLSKARKAATKMGITPQKKKAITKNLLEAIISTCGGSLIDIRDKALLLFAFASGGRRRSEVAKARTDNLTSVEGGYVYHMPYSKTDQEGEGSDLPVLGLAAIALNEWLKASGIKEGYLFRGITKNGKVLEGISGKTVARIVKKRALMAGLDSSIFGGHSLRSGFITEAGRQGKALADAMALSGHRTISVALGYHQAGSVIHNPAARLMD